MTILFCGGELEDFTAAGSVVFTTASASQYRSAYARGGLDISASGPAAAVSTYAAASFTPSTSFSFTGRFYGGSSSTSAGSIFIAFMDGANSRLRLKISTVAPTVVVLEKFDGTTATTLATSTLTLALGILYRFDVIVDYSASGRIRFYVDQNLFIDYSGDPRAGGSTTLNGLRLGSWGASVANRWSEVIVATQDTRTLSLVTLTPNAAGTANAWVGAYTDIDEPTASETDVMTSATANQIANVNTTGMPAGATNLGVIAVKVAASAARGSTGPTKLALGVRTNGSDSFPTAVTLDTGFTTPTETYYQQNPVTAAAWTSAEVDALQIAFRSEA